MSKWHKIVIRDPTLPGTLNPVKMLEFLGKINNRRKMTRRTIEIIRINGLASYPIEYCFKFKDKEDAFAFKLRWL